MGMLRREQQFLINSYYDDWEDHRDGFRDWFRDFKKIKNVKDKQWSHLFEKRTQMNNKQKRLWRRRKVKSKQHIANLYKFILEYSF